VTGRGIRFAVGVAALALGALTLAPGLASRRAAAWGTGPRAQRDDGPRIPDGTAMTSGEGAGGGRGSGRGDGGRGSTVAASTGSAPRPPTTPGSTTSAARPLRLLPTPAGGWFPVTAAPAEVAPAVGDPSPAVYGPPFLPLTFDHARHARRGITCDRCHAAAWTSTVAKDSLLPGEAACRACHAIDRDNPARAVAAGQPPARCDACHPGFVPPPGPAGRFATPPQVSIPTAALKFNHRLHGTRGIACALCHTGVEEVALATTLQLPRMGLCLGCHDGRQATARCAACHVTLPDGRLRTEFPAGSLAPSGSLRGVDAHTVAFRTDHRTAGRDERYCATCHKQSECTECHGAGVVRPADFHPGDYATLHAVDARRNMPDCSSCHRNQTFCLGCHQRLGVASDPEGGLPGRQPSNPFGTGSGVKQFHPPGWVRDETGSVIQTATPASHSFQARRNIRSCVSCHREESCLGCHSADPTRSPAINPHRPGFGTSAACRAMSARNQRACLKCHEPGAPALWCE
jgi:Cytochrome c7 and related cytochrome c